MTLRRGILFSLAVLLAACSGDTGPAGPMGDPGGDGMMGSDGPPGPITDPPSLTALSPRWGSANTHVTITGTNFSTTAGDNHVFFDGHAATVVTATATQLVVTPDVAVDTATNVVVNVEVANQVSNGLFFALVESGTAVNLDAPLPSSPTGVAVIGNDIYIAAGFGNNARTGGLFKVSNGVVTQLVAGKLVQVDIGTSIVPIMDVPLAITAFQNNIYYTTTFGAVRKYTVATGVVTDVFSLAPVGNINQFPQRTGIVFDSAGALYVVDRSGPGILRMATNGTISGLVDGLLGDLYGIASDGNDLFVTNPTTSAVIKIATPGGTPAFTTVATDGGGGDLKGITLVGTNVIVSDELGFLVSTAKSATGGALATFGDTGGYVDEATGLAALGTDLVLAQPAGGVVRRKPAANMDATIVSTGVRFSVGTMELNGKLYVSTFGSALFRPPGGPPTTMPDGAITEISPDGTSRVLATAFTPLGLTTGGANQLTVSDCFEGRIYTLDVTTAAQVDLLIASDFSGCPLGIARDATALYYIDSDTVMTIGKLAGTTQTASFASGLGPDAAVLAIAGGQLITSSIFDPVPLQKAPVATGGAMTTLATVAVFGQGSLRTSADGTLYALRQGSGELSTIDVTTGAVTPVGSIIPGTLARSALTGSFALGADNTATVMDYVGGQIVRVAP